MRTFQPQQSSEGVELDDEKKLTSKEFDVLKLATASSFCLDVFLDVVFLKMTVLCLRSQVLTATNVRELFSVATDPTPIRWENASQLLGAVKGLGPDWIRMEHEWRGHMLGLWVRRDFLLDLGPVRRFVARTPLVRPMICNSPSGSLLNRKPPVQAGLMCRSS